MVGYALSLLVWTLLNLATSGMFVLETTALMVVLMRLSLFVQALDMGLPLTGFRLNVGSIDHSHNGALHWTISLIGGFVIGAIIGQTFTATSPFNLNNWFTPPQNFALYVIPFIFGFALVYYALKEW